MAKQSGGGWLRRVLLLGVAVGIVLLLWQAMRPTPVLVDLAPVTRQRLSVTVDDDGRTRVRDRYVVSAPILGQLLRTPLRPGDPVVAGETLLAAFVPAVSTPLDARTREEARARLERARAALAQAEAAREQLAADQEFTAAEQARFEDLVQDGIQAPDQLERAVRDARRAEQALRAGEFAVQVARFEVELAEAALWEPAGDGGEADGGADPTGPADGGRHEGSIAFAPDSGRLELRSPVDGVVLRVFEESTRTLAAGTPIFELADIRALEVEAEYLTQDAVKVEPGMPARIVGWGGADAAGREQPLRAVVRRVEPGGFTKVSALGVEEQRVRILLDPVRSDGDGWAALGDGFRVEVRIELWAEDDVLTVPIGALFRPGDGANPGADDPPADGGWAVYKVVDGAAVRQRIRVGRMGRLHAQVLAGLRAGDRVILYPSELIAPGTGVAAR